jgi:hypothetical protein
MGGLTKDDVMGMALEAGLGSGRGLIQITKFAALVAAAEREACAKVCDEVEASMQNGKRTKDGDHAAFTAGIIAERIRARRQQENG